MVDEALGRRSRAALHHALRVGVVVGLTLLVVEPARAQVSEAEAQRLVGDGNLSDEDIPQLIRLLGDMVYASEARDRLARELARTRPALLAALEDPTLRVVPPRQGRAPVEDVFLVLATSPDARTLEVARGLLGGELVLLRKGAARIIGAGGAPEDAQRLAALLGNKDEVVDVRHAAITGMGSGASRLPPEWSGLFPAVAEELVHPSPSEFGDPGTVPALLALDPERALEFLQGPEVLRPELEALPQVLVALRKRRVVVPTARLLDLLSGLEGRAEPHRGAADPRVTIVRLIERVEDPRVDEALRRLSTASRGAEVAMVAAQARCRRAGLDPDAAADAINELEDASPAVRTYCLLWAFDAEVRNGGFRQFLGNSTGRYAAETLAALRAVGAEKSATLLAEVAACFGPDGPPVDDEARDAALAAIPKRAGEQFLFYSFDVQYYDQDEPVLARAYVYALDHPEDFRRPPRPQ